MSDDKNKTDYRDRAQVNSNESYELQYWSKKWGITVEELKDAIAKSGSNYVKELEDYLKRR